VSRNAQPLHDPRNAAAERPFVVFQAAGSHHHRNRNRRDASRRTSHRNLPSNYRRFSGRLSDGLLQEPQEAFELERSVLLMFKQWL